jgi:hypothetical protein
VTDVENATGTQATIKIGATWVYMTCMYLQRYRVLVYMNERGTLVPKSESCYLMPQFEDCTVERGANSLDLTLSSGFGDGFSPSSHTVVTIAWWVKKIRRRIIFKSGVCTAKYPSHPSTSHFPNTILKPVDYPPVNLANQLNPSKFPKTHHSYPAQPQHRRTTEGTTQPDHVPLVVLR